MAMSWLDPTWMFNVLLVVLGLGMVIFVHELGHFIVAKLCGVKCEKFYLGFDIGGLKLWKAKWGETEYGIGILPLGGYVKMLGQEDNPARLREEIERAKAQQPQAGTTQDSAANAASPSPSQPSPDAPTAESLAQAQAALYDPRSYLAQSVPRRMAIISAGVVMNVIFAIVMGALAYRIGVYQLVCGVGAVTPGAAAWQANLQPGDQITGIQGEPVQRFAELKAVMSVGDVEAGVPLEIHRPGHPEPFTVTIRPNLTRPVPTIGILPPYSTSLDRDFPIIPASTAARASPGFLPRDRVVQIQGAR